MSGLVRRFKRIKYSAIDLNGDKLSDIKLVNQNWVLVLGSEAHGIRMEISALLNHKLTIPGTGKPESINVAVAGGIIMNYLNSAIFYS